MDALLEEIESLEAILMEDVIIKRNAETAFPESVETTVFPLVGEDRSSFVCVTLVVGLVPGYPEARPNFTLKNPRGLCDSTLDSISRNINSKLDESLGCPVVFDLIEVVREYLSDSNVPSGQCVICLYGFQESDQFTKTECYHYLHTYCLARHLDASKRNYDEDFNKLPAWQRLTAKPYQASCPVCREQIHCDRDAMSEAAAPDELVRAPKFKLTEEIRCLQAKLSNLYILQKERGGIIDVQGDEPQILAIVDPREAEAERERVRQREIEREAAALAEAEKTAVTKKTNKKSKSHYEHKPKDHHHHHKKGHHGYPHRSHKHGSTGNADAHESGGQASSSASHR